MKRILAALALGAVSVGLWVAEARTAVPEPSPVLTSWQLDIALEVPKAVSLKIDGKDQTFWYLRYTVMNRTREDQVFIPDFVLYTDTGQVLRAGRGVPVEVFESIKKMLKDPLLKDPFEVSGRLLQGEDNAKSSLAIWPDFDPQSGGFNVFVGGLSGETKAITLPTPIDVTKVSPSSEPVTEQQTKAVLVKTLELTYQVVGEAAARAMSRTELQAKRWVMR